MHACVCVCVCVDKPVAVELRCHATALINNRMPCSEISTFHGFHQFSQVGSMSSLAVGSLFL